MWRIIWLRWKRISFFGYALGLTFRRTYGSFLLSIWIAPGRSVGFGETTLWVWSRRVLRRVWISLLCSTCSMLSGPLGMQNLEFYRRKMAIRFLGKAGAFAGREKQTFLQYRSRDYNFILCNETIIIITMIEYLCPYEQKKRSNIVDGSQWKWLLTEDSERSNTRN